MSKFEQYLMESKSITIEKSQGEYRVPSEDGYEDGAYYTDDKEDAIGTAKKVFGDDVVIKFRSVSEFVGGKYEKMRPKNESLDEETINEYFYVYVIDKQGSKKFVDSTGRLVTATNKVAKFDTRDGAKTYITTNNLKDKGYLEVTVASKKG